MALSFLVVLPRYELLEYSIMRFLKVLLVLHIPLTCSNCLTSAVVSSAHKEKGLLFYADTAWLSDDEKHVAFTGLSSGKKEGYVLVSRKSISVADSTKHTIDLNELGNICAKRKGKLDFRYGTLPEGFHKIQKSPNDPKHVAVSLDLSESKPHHLLLLPASIGADAITLPVQVPVLQALP